MARNATGALLRRKSARLSLIALVSILPVVFLASSPGPRDRIGSVIDEWGYSVASWEVENLPDKWLNQLTSLFGGGNSENEGIEAVLEYFRLNEELSAIDHEISRVVSGGEGELQELLARREVLDDRRSAIQDEVEETIEGQISGVLSDEGLSWKLPFGDSDGYLFPPVDFRFDDSPSVLAISPRERIELIDTRLLNPDLRLEDIEEIEGGVEEGEEISALVTGTGGVATYPSVIPLSTSLRDTLRTIAHEWVHHYMIFYPLGRHYWDSVDMTTINETIAGVIGNEVGDRVYHTYYADLMDDAPVRPPTSPMSTVDRFDFNREMRETRLRADELLAQGKVEEAERYLEEQRLFLADNGFFFRKLNQAFFAFHGIYADAPTSVDPIGGQVKGLRRRSVSLKDFIQTVSGISGFDEFLSYLEAE
ncbi:MAG: hypothetical protein ACE5KI_01525 [Dehalococcoidia bacterium]